MKRTATKGKPIERCRRNDVGMTEKVTVIGWDENGKRVYVTVDMEHEAAKRALACYGKSTL